MCGQGGVNIGKHQICEKKKDVYKRQAVASTKAYSVQTGVLYLLAIRIAMEKGRISEEQAAFYVDRLQEAIELTHEALKADEKAKELSAILKDMEDLFFIGRGADFPLCREGSLKLKEISYIPVSHTHLTGPVKFTALG